MSTHTDKFTIDPNNTDTAAFSEEQIKEYDISPEQVEQYGKQDEPTVEPVEESNELLAGKFKSTEDLDKSYLELQKRLGDPATPAIETEAKEEPTEEEEVKEGEEPEAKQEDPEELRRKFDELPDSEEKEVVSRAVKELETTGKLTDDVFKAFEQAGIPKELVQQHKELQDFKAQQEVTNLMNLAGGEKGYSELVSWAKGALNENEINVFDGIMDNGSSEEVSFAISNLKARMDAAQGTKQSKLIKADALHATEEGYRSQAEMLADMNSKEYDTNPAYRRKVMDKARKSNF